jgi:hypothetical protein
MRREHNTHSSERPLNRNSHRCLHENVSGIYCLVHPVCFVLAGRLARGGALSSRVAIVPSVSPGRHNVRSAIRAPSRSLVIADAHPRPPDRRRGPHLIELRLTLVVADAPWIKCP